MEKEWRIAEIEALTEDEASKLAIEHLKIKGHDVYLVDFGGYFGYSALVFLNGGHVYHANDYALHHRYVKYHDDGTTEVIYPEREDLRERYVKSLEGSKLYTEAEIIQPSKTYDEQQTKEHYLRNYYPMQKPYISMFFIGSDAEREAIRKQTESMTWCPVAFCWFYDADFATKICDLYEQMIDARQESKNSFEYQKSAFKHELYNHEYAINWQGDWDVFSCFGSVPYKDGVSPDWYMQKLNFTDTQKKAFYAARSEYYRECEQKEYGSTFY